MISFSSSNPKLYAGFKRREEKAFKIERKKKERNRLLEVMSAIPSFFATQPPAHYDGSTVRMTYSYYKFSPSTFYLYSQLLFCKFLV